MRKNPHDRILKWVFKEQYLNIVPKSCPYLIKDIYGLILLGVRIQHFINRMFPIYK